MNRALRWAIFLVGTAWLCAALAAETNDEARRVPTVKGAAPPSGGDIARWFYELQGRLDQLEHTNQALTQQLSDERRGRQQLEGRLERLLNQQQQLLRRLDQSETSRQQLQTQMSELEQENLILQFQLIDIENISYDAKEQSDQAQTDQREQHRQLQRLDGDSLMLQRRLDQLQLIAQRLNEAVTSQKSSVRAIEERMAQSLEALQAQHNAQRQRLNQLDLAQETHRLRLDRLNTVSERMDSALFSVEEQLALVSAGHLHLEEAMARLNANLACLSPESDTQALILEGCNLWLRNGSGETHSGNGFGNLIIGYNRGTSVIANKERGGSHNLVIGDEHRYTSTGGIVAGYANAIGGVGASVIGGAYNIADGPYASIAGGSQNAAKGVNSSIGGGSHKTVWSDNGEAQLQSLPRVSPPALERKLFKK